MNEVNMLDCEGKLTDKQLCLQILISEIHEDNVIPASLQISIIKSRRFDCIINNNIDKDSEEKVEPQYQPIPQDAFFNFWSIN